jgi:hypothetical protein
MGRRVEKTVEKSVKRLMKARRGGTERFSTETDSRRGGDRILTRIFSILTLIAIEFTRPTLDKGSQLADKKEFVILRPLSARRVSTWATCKVESLRAESALRMTRGCFSAPE